MIRKKFLQTLIVTTFFLFISTSAHAQQSCADNCVAASLQCANIGLQEYYSCTNNCQFTYYQCVYAGGGYSCDIQNQQCMYYYCDGINTYYYSYCNNLLQNCKAGCDPYCGDGNPDPGETYQNCPQDTLCGNGICNAGETNANCPGDCPCNYNGVCDNGETYQNCPGDCHCGNGTCDGALGETSANCQIDCNCQGYCYTEYTQCGQIVQSCVDGCWGDYSCIVACSYYASYCQGNYEACMYGCN